MYHGRPFLALLVLPFPDVTADPDNPEADFFVFPNMLLSVPG